MPSADNTVAGIFQKPSAIELNLAANQRKTTPRFPEATGISGLWVRVPIAKWSLSTLGTPIYPQARFELGVARAIAAEIDSEFEVRAVLLGTASRTTGSRERVVLEGSTAIERAGHRFFFNTTPRPAAASLTAKEGGLNY